MKNNNPKGFVPIIIIAFVVAIALAMVGVGIYFKVENDKQVKEQKNTNQIAANTNTVINLNNEANTNTNTNTAANTNTATDETAGWQTYTNTSLGYSIQYPDGWKAEDVFEGNYLKNLSNDNQIIQVIVNDYNPNQLSINDWAKTQGWQFKSIGNISGLGAVEQSPTGTVYFTKGTKVVHATNGISFERKIIDEELFLKILSTFQFTDETAGWKTYTNSAVGYSVKYPDSWSLKETNEPSDIIAGQTARYITIANPVTNHSLHLGVRKTGDTQIDIWSRTGIGAGDFQAGDTVIIGGTQVQSTKLVYQSKAVEIFYSPVEHATQPVVIGSYDVSAYFSNMTGDDSDLTSSVDYQTANTILSTLTFAK